MTWVTRARVIPASDFGLSGDPPWLQKGPPLHGLTEEFNHSGRLGFSGRLGIAPGRRDGTQDPICPYLAGHDADVGVFEGPLRPEGNFDRLFPIGHHRAAVGAFLGDVDDPEPDLRLRDAPPAVSRAAHPGSHMGLETISDSEGVSVPPRRSHSSNCLG